MKIDKQHLACLLSEDWNHDRISIAPITVKEPGYFCNAQVKR